MNYGIENYEEKLGQALAIACNAFWFEVADTLQEIKGGDFPPEADKRLESVMRESIDLWVKLNTKDSDYIEGE